MGRPRTPIPAGESATESSTSAAGEEYLTARRRAEEPNGSPVTAAAAVGIRDGLG